MSSDLKSLAHTKWNCKYHVVFAPKYRRRVFYGEKRRAIGEILRKLCEWKGITIVNVMNPALLPKRDVSTNEKILTFSLNGI